jgi:hypothetical protein
MAVYKLFPSQDAAIYSAYPAMNTGLDPILDVSNYVSSSDPIASVARSLVKFDQSEINNVIKNIASVTSSFDFTASLKLFIAKADNVILESSVEVYPISGSWNNGSGQFLDNRPNDTGVSWVYSAFSGSSPWTLEGFFEDNTTGSYAGSNNAGGGVWWTGSGGFDGIGSLESSQVFNLRSDKDLNTEVTDIVKVWYSSSNNLLGGLTPIANEGFIIKWEDSTEFTTSSAVTPQLSFYSVDTNTIYPPELDIKWRDFTYSTSSGDFKPTRILTGSYPINELTSSIPYTFTQSLPNNPTYTGNGTGATFGATFNSASMLDVYVKDLGLGYIAGETITWTPAQLNSLPAVTGAVTNAVVTISTYDIQQLTTVSTPDLFVALDDNQGIFYSESINQFRLNVRPQFPTRVFETSSMYTHNEALPSASYYAIKDLETNEFVIEFDTQNTQISCDPTGSFFTIYMNGLEPERNYQILIQTNIDNNVIIMDEKYYFKVING